MKKPIYLDYAATCPIDQRVLDKMLNYMSVDGAFGNPASSSHRYGWEAKEAVKFSRERVASLINAKTSEIIFTSGATESNNLAIYGLVRNYAGHGKHIITCETEHKAVLDPCKQLQREGFEVTYLTPEPDGRLDLAKLEAAIRPDTLLVSIMHANNEIGVIQDIAAIDRICREHEVFLHIDAAQSAGKIPLDLREIQADLVSISGHKLYGPKGIGALFVRDGIVLKPLIYGGGHENGFRSGTLPTHQIVGFGYACQLAEKEMEQDRAHTSQLSDRMAHALKTIKAIKINGSMEHRLPHNLNISVGFVRGDQLLKALREVAVSSGAACISDTMQPSYVLLALGLDVHLAHSTIRISFGRQTTLEEVEIAIDYLKNTIEKLREKSMHWKHLQAERIDPDTLEEKNWNF